MGIIKEGNSRKGKHSPLADEDEVGMVDYSREDDDHVISHDHELELYAKHDHDVHHGGHGHGHGYDSNSHLGRHGHEPELC